VLNLPDVTLCAVTGTFLTQTLAAIEHARACARFGDILFVTDRPSDVPSRPDMRIVGVGSLRSREEYSAVVQTGLDSYVTTPFVMLVQWDGYPVRPENWTDDFLSYDYLGAPWPQFPAPFSVGNGGFSLRSKRLLQACRDPRFQPFHPEDIGICHRNRALLEEDHGLRFAPVDLAARFSCERMGTRSAAFGFHGVFNMPWVMGLDPFLNLFSTLDWAQVGVRELLDVREVLLADGGPRARAEAGRLAREVLCRRWRDPALRSYVRRKLTRRTLQLPG